MKNIIAKLTAIGKIELFEEEVQKLKDGEVLVRIKSSGICGSDMHYFLRGGLGSFKQPLPMNMGHEPSGIIIDSNGSKKFKDSTRVAIEPGHPCVTSKWSLKGKHNLCDEGTFMGATAQGSFAKYAVVSESQLATMPDDMSYDMGALLEPLGVALHTINIMNVGFLDSFTIFGAGPIGLCMFFMCKKMGVRDIILIDKNQHRVDFAKSLGAHSFNLKDDFIKSIKTITGEKGTTCAVDTAGEDESIDGCIRAVDVTGKLALVGIPTKDFLSYNPHKIRIKEMKIFNVRRSNQTLEHCISLFGSDFGPEKMVTHNFDLARIQEAFDLVAVYGDGVIKCMINP